MAHGTHNKVAKPRGRPVKEVPFPVGGFLPTHTGIIGRNADHRMTVSLCAFATSDYRVLDGASLGYLGEAWYLRHVERQNKDGEAMVFGEMRGGRRDEHCKSSTALVYEVDGKLGEADIVERVRQRGLQAFVWSTHNHFRTQQQVPLKRFQEWMRKQGLEGEITSAMISAFCAQDVKYDHLRNVRSKDGGRVYRVKHRGVWVDVLDIVHEPEEKWRIVFPLAVPIRIGLGGLTKKQFAALYHSFGTEVFGSAYSGESSDPARIHYLPSHKPGSPFKAFQFEGDLLHPDPLLATLVCGSETAPKRPHLNLTAPTRRELAQLLEVIPCDLPYPDWFKVIAAVFHETGGTGEGNELVHDWSSGDPRYDFDQVERIWDSLDPDHPSPVTFGTLVKLAADYRPRSSTARASTLSLAQQSTPLVSTDWRRHVNKSFGV